MAGEKTDWGAAPPWMQAPMGKLWAAAAEYAVDSLQRATLFMDVMRERGNQYLAQTAKTAPHVLNFEGDLLLDGRKFPRPVNYGLVRIHDKDGAAPDARQRPFVIVDPRAGHGPGIGGFKSDSEIGVALKAGHPVYFVGFTPLPEPGQTVPDVLQAFATFLEKVAELHPDANGKPMVVGNCQAGWAVMMTAALRPELFGPIMVAGSPMSYWAGVRGVNPMRYSGGMLGGAWLASLAGDLGNGVFDGAHLVQNFENLNPSNTLWTKQYNLYANIDTEPQRYLGFEKWWGAHVTLARDEIEFIVDELFVGNRLASGRVKANGEPIDLRNVKGPIIVLCSHGDNITPPQQALGWILDLYKDVDDIAARGQTIVYTVHETIGHLGIFVSGSVAKKEHDEFTGNTDLIDVLPPGLYEMMLTKNEGAANAELGTYTATFQPRTLDDIRALGGNDVEDERRFATVARVSEINSALYKRCLSPLVRATSNETVAEALRELHPLRVQYSAFADRNPLMKAVEQAAKQVRSSRRPAAKDNPFRVMEAQISGQIEASLDAYRDWRDRMVEQTFLAVYGSPLLQGMVGFGPGAGPPREHPSDSADYLALKRRRLAEVRSLLAEGGPREGAIRALLYCGMAEGSVDERSFVMLRSIYQEHGENLPIAEFKKLVREQYYLLRIDGERAVAAIPDLIGRNSEDAQRLLPLIHRVLLARGPLSGERAVRFARIEALLTDEPQRPVQNRKARPAA